MQQAWSMLEDFICSAESSEESLKLLSKVSAAATACTQSLTVAQVCQMLSLSPRTVYELANVPIRVEEFMSDNGLIKRVLPSCRNFRVADYSPHARPPSTLPPPRPSPQG